MVVFSNHRGDQIEPPMYRHPDQIWTFFSRESPLIFPREKTDLSLWNRRFNWTMTYRRDSDIPVFYGGIKRKPDATGNDVYVHFYELFVSLFNACIYIIITKVLESNFKSKTGMAAAVMSAWYRPSKRLEYIQELQQVGIDVDIYGKCGKPCPTNSSSPAVCYKELSKTYKFFLAFENSFCKDYATEKVFAALKQPWIPVVRGGADYSLILPEKSVVDASSLSPAQLSSILHEIASNETLYRSYFEWKKMFSSEGSEGWVCDACQKLRNVTARKTYDDIYDWWVVKSNCSTN